MKKFYRSSDDRILAGVCGGISKITNVDPLLWRLLFFGLVFTPFPIILFYLLIGLITESIHWKD